MVRTRFAPSPTGYLHIGGVRTALFNWLFARKHGGQFVLRIDDTDVGREVAPALEAILHGFRWLGLDWDEGPEVNGPFEPYYQSQRSESHKQAVQQLLAAGAAYKDYSKPEEYQAERTAAEQEKRNFRYSRTWAAWTNEDEARFESEGRTAVVRLKMPEEGQIIVDDLIRGRVEFNCATEQDSVVARADGSVLYNLASIVDDHGMQITHVIRSEEHLSNTPRQIFIAQGLGYELPKFAHVPYVAEPSSRNKLSKRKLDKYLKNKEFAKLNDLGQAIAQQISLATSAETFNPVIVDFYEQVGFLADALVNYLLLLGWSLDDHTEDFSRQQMLESFSLERVNKAPASFDPAKLVSFQDRYMQKLPVKQKVALVLPYLQQAELVSSPPPCETSDKLKAIVEAAGERIKIAGDILDYTDFYTADDKLSYDEKAFAKRLTKPDDAVPLLTKFRSILANTLDWSAANLEQTLKDFMEAEGIGFGQIIHALRVATTGKAVGFGMFETLEILGKESTLARIDRALSLATSSIAS
ncbi:MAG: glutamate--tRNA ligase [Pirellulales bacterium]|nr:glutamate--tRNA ligase [Pirellulales bacterium]